MPVTSAYVRRLPAICESTRPRRPLSLTLVRLLYRKQWHVRERRAVPSVPLLGRADPSGILRRLAKTTTQPEEPTKKVAQQGDSGPVRIPGRRVGLSPPVLMRARAGRGRKDNTLDVTDVSRMSNMCLCKRSRCHWVTRTSVVPCLGSNPKHLHHERSGIVKRYLRLRVILIRTQRTRLAAGAWL